MLLPSDLWNKLSLTVRSAKTRSTHCTNFEGLARMYEPILTDIKVHV